MSIQGDSFEQISSIPDSISISKFERLAGELEIKADSILGRADLSRLIESLLAIVPNQIVDYKPNGFGQLVAMLRNQRGDNDAELCRRLVIIRCAINNLDDIFSEKYVASVQERYQQTLKRIYSMAQSTEGWSQYNDDVYWKDLGLVRGLLFPVGAQVVDTYSGFAIKPGFSHGVVQGFNFLNLLLRYGRKGYYQIHTHTPDLGEFSEQGWNDCYIRIADMLKINPKIKGVVAGSWFYDPIIENISPRLEYLSRVPIINGAQRFYLYEDKSGNALSTSKTRRVLYEKGEYIPKVYLIVWLRKDILKWAGCKDRG